MANRLEGAAGGAVHGADRLSPREMIPVISSLLQAELWVSQKVADH